MRCVAAVVGACLALAGAAPAWAGVDLRTAAPSGRVDDDQAALAAVGDVNGDGVADLAAGPEFGRPPLGDVYTIAFGPALPPTTGLRVTHAEAPVPADGYGVGGSVAGVGDWNGDGLADVAFGAVGTAPHGRRDAGSVYVILGRRAPGDVDARSDPGVVRIDGPAAHSGIGDGIAGVGDIDGDGRPDLAIPLHGGRAVIVRGGLPGGTTLDLAHPSAGATIGIRGLTAGRTLFGAARLVTFAAAGDLDGDGRGELLAGVTAFEAPGRVLVLRGVPAGATIDAGDPRARLARVVGRSGGNGFGGTLATVPDTDGDGHPEWLIGAPLPSGEVRIGGDTSGHVDLVFSRARGEIRPGRAGQPVAGLRVAGEQRAGRTLAGLPDVTGDGVPDWLVGLPEAAPSCRGGAGAVALVAGRATPGPVRLGPRIDGSRPGAGLGDTLAVAGDAAVMGELPFENAAFLNLWRLPLSGLAAPSPALPALDRCLKVTLARVSRARLVRTGRLRLMLRSDAGDGRAHEVVLATLIGRGRRLAVGPSRVVRFRSAGSRRVTLRLPRRARGLLAGRARADVTVTAQQRVGRGIRVTDDAFSGGYLTFGHRPRSPR
jgi:hypothetical protein